MSKMTLALLLGLLSADPTAADAPLADPELIVEKANLAVYYAGADMKTETRMLISDAQGRTQRRQFSTLRRDVSDGGEQHMLVVFSQPSDVRGTVYLVNKRPGEDDNRWLYLPGLDLVKRVSAGDKRTSFVGAHSYYEDISGRWLAADRHELIETTDAHYVLRHTPLDPDEVEFSSYSTSIDRVTFLPMKIEYRNAAGSVYRRVEALAVETIQGYPTITQLRVSDLESGGYTEVRLRWAEYDQQLPDELFSERSLRNPPLEWLKPSSQSRQ